MEKITDKIDAIPKDGSYFSLEFFPPKTQMVVIFSLHANLIAMADASSGLLQSSNTTRANVTRAPPSVRHRDLGRWR